MLSFFAALEWEVYDDGMRPASFFDVLVYLYTYNSQVVFVVQIFSCREGLLVARLTSAECLVQEIVQANEQMHGDNEGLRRKLKLSRLSPSSACTS